MVKDPLRRHEAVAGAARVHRPDAASEASVTRTLPAPPDAVTPWLTDPGRRRRWLDVDPEVRSATAVRSLRWGWPDGTRVTLRVLPAPGGRTRLSVRHLLPSGAAPEAEAGWVERLDRLAAVVGDGSAG
ncbi:MULTISPECIES: hypothetical protein [unclassified Actinotalea]|uniref:hypothetical protein n=1 Tax=unclassified Actinotalea TaxID=2638618 RepID=UPI0015F5E217|nr:MULTISPECIES: hypothetical protein [unclassified Actinotalea]